MTHQGHEGSGLHDGVELRAPLRPGLHLISKQVSGGEMAEAILVHDLGALSALATPRPSHHEYHLLALQLLHGYNAYGQAVGVVYPH